ncbi:MAG: hypothetical protein JWM68_1843 [Verrucomicrobiales bacterium]|nr:hypothetical protein [Verrucomicrobiales bacterium]
MTLLNRICSVLFPTFAAASLAIAANAVPRPFTPVKATTAQFRCLGRTTDLGQFVLPTQIVAADKPLLNAPIRLVSEPDIFASIKGAAKVVEKNDNQARWEWKGESADVSMAAKMTADCDGFCWYEIQLTPKHAIKLNALRLEIPRVAATARYLHTSSYDWSNVSQGLPERGGKWADKFTPYVWLGDEQRGLAWCAESDQGWQLKNPARAISVDTTNGVVLFQATMLDHEETVTAPITVRFGLQSSPVKTVSFAWRAKARILHDIHYDSAVAGADGRCELDKLREGGAKTVVIHDSWTKYFGQMVPADAGKFKQLIDACHQRGLKLLVYVGYGIARTAPELQGKHDEWSVLPLIPWDPGYKPETRGFDATCARSGWNDWLVAGTEKLFSDYDLDGLYFDGTSEGWTCRNQSHGCGWKDAQGNVHAVFPMLAARNLMRRIADAVHRHKSDAILDAHMSSNLTLPTLSFCDSLWNGEQFESHTSAEKFSVPLHFFRTEFMGYAHGMDMEFLCYENRPFTFDEAIALAWVHGIEVRPYPGNLSHVTPVWRALDHFDITTAKWQPYWLGSGVKADLENVKVSAWTHKGKALLFASHLERKPVTAHLDLDRKALGLKNRSLEIKDALSGETLAVKDNAIDLAFTGMSFRILEISGK